MSASTDLQAAIIELLGQPGALRVNVPLLARRPKELANEVEAAWTLSGGLCAHVLPVLPTKIIDDLPFVHVERGDLVVRVAEKPSLSASRGANAWQIADDICNALQWQPKAAGTKLGALVAHPLTLAPTCVSVFNGPEFGQDVRFVDVLFNANYGLSSGPALAVGIDGTFASAAEGLQACFKAQLDGTLTQPIPTIIQRDHDLGSRIATAGNPVMIEILPPMPARALQDVPFVFFEGYQVRAKVTEYPALNSGLDAYEVVEEVMAALHWQPFGDFLAHPLQLAERPTDCKDNLDRREIDVIFNATLGFQPS